MSRVTFQVIEGLERGAIFRNLDLPLTIGREEDNEIRLNDERVSRLHARVQQIDGEPILTDLQSTNGTRVNGVPLQMHKLTPGDYVSVGRCLLRYGDPESLMDEYKSAFNTLPVVKDSPEDDDDFDLEPPPETISQFEEKLRLFPNGIPKLPLTNNLQERTHLNDFVAYIHTHLVSLIQNSEVRPQSEFATEQDDPQEVVVQWDEWQRLLNMSADLAVVMKRIAEHND